MNSIPWGPRFRAAYYASILARCSLSCSRARKDSIEHKRFQRLGRMAVIKQTSMDVDTEKKGTVISSLNKRFETLLMIY